jgi:hypothetical protein
MELAEECVPGFKVVNPGRGGRGRHRGLGAVNRRELYEAINAREDLGEKIDQECRTLSRDRKGRWSSMSPETLETRYHEYKRLRLAVKSFAN